MSYEMTALLLGLGWIVDSIGILAIAISYVIDCWNRHKEWKIEHGYAE